MKKRIWIPIVVGCIFTALAFFIIARIIDMAYQPGAVATATSAPEDTETKSTTESETDAPKEYVSPVDFEALQAINPDIYAWIAIDDTFVDFPVVQRADDDLYYMDHNSDLKYSSAGALFTEHEYNTTDFTDPVTVIYGHDLRSGTMFGNLQKDFTNEKFLEKDPVIDIYLPDRHLQYQVFSSVPYSPEHILYDRDFADKNVYKDFFRQISKIDDDLATNVDTYSPKYGDRVLVLSTCLKSDPSQRFIVMGKLIYDSTVDGF